MAPGVRVDAPDGGPAPRTHGDGPLGLVDDITPDGCSPHARGWPPRSSPPSPSSNLLPARAGMAPSRASALVIGGTAPRTRGDGPVTRVQLSPLWLCSPHARGWPPRRDPDGLDQELLPARAGMAPTCTVRPRRTDSAPRTRGDGPGTLLLHPRRPDCSPHARGWSRRKAPAVVCLQLLTARAGMVPGRALRRRCVVAAPRTRGDGPGTYIQCRGEVICSPHARGSSSGLPRSPAGRPLPARAGTVPEQSDNESLFHCHRAVGCRYAT